MTSSHPLNPDLLEVLVPFTTPVAQTAANFRELLSGADEFTRVCELHNTLDILTMAEDPMQRLWELRGQTDRDGANAKDAEDLLGLMVNSEFVLYSMYSEYDISLNPNLSHWVEVCRGMVEMPRGGATIMQRILRIRAAFVKGILGGQGEMLGPMSPEHFAHNGMDFDIDVDRFREALRSQGIYDHDPLFAGTPVPSTPYNAPPTPSYAPPTPLSGPPSEASPPAQDSVPMSQQITSAILHGIEAELPPALTNKLLSFMSRQPALVTLLSPDLLSSVTIPGLIDHNPQLARVLISMVFSHGTKVQRKEVVSALPYVPITIPGLDLINDIVTKTQFLTYDETCILVHEVLENGIRRAESMGAAGGNGYDGTGGGGGGLGLMGAQRQAQSRHIKLLCLFIQSLLRHDVVDLQQLYYQIQGIGVKFMFVQEARELWRTYCAGVEV